MHRTYADTVFLRVCSRPGRCSLGCADSVDVAGSACAALGLGAGYAAPVSLRPADVELLEALFAEGSTAGAATFLGVQQSTVSRRLSGLEERVGAELFVRAPRGLVPTPLAERLRPLVAQASGALRTADALFGEAKEAVSGLVRVALPEAFAQYIVIPRLPRLRQQHPELELAILDGPEVVDLARAEAHLAVRVPRPTSGEVVAKRYLVDRIGLYGTPAYVAGRAFADLEVLGWDASHEHLPEAKLLAALGARIPLRFQRMTTMVEACRTGVGVALIGSRLAAELGLAEVEDPGPLPPPRARSGSHARRPCGPRRRSTRCGASSSRSSRRRGAWTRKATEQVHGLG